MLLLWWWSALFVSTKMIVEVIVSTKCLDSASG
jgi:hypothetical protein